MLLWTSCLWKPLKISIFFYGTYFTSSSDYLAWDMNYEAKLIVQCLTGRSCFLRHMKHQSSFKIVKKWSLWKYFAFFPYIYISQFSMVVFFIFITLKRTCFTLQFGKRVYLCFYLQLKNFNLISLDFALSVISVSSF